ncbi:DUF2254 domain-containing protein [Sulfitobacter guttiformis]|uniref:Putative membrane protein n=1 Tax=Sulfitobacter guttiformis TaxID=74349 RepID=A0A420DUH8_9RHOB|nr:DUF2254 domain-containing protein [Sulfitobacter guttiformis]KIN71479.1 hypothetical protein Z949_640 [Sulfitobacter guttiformis KCTC 32187]RKE97912.1 putative membrane protein [Sulfitobacter guttiformis]
MAASFSITRVTALWGRLNSSFWFVPAAMALSAIALSFVLIEVDGLLDVAQSDRPGALFTFGPEGARATLSVIASSMITVASLIFSITMLSLQLASSQFGPRTLGNFMRDRSNQIVLGTFIATFLYCLFVLRSVRGTEGASFSSFVPHLAVAFGVLMAAASVAVLLYFIHHIATSIRVETLLEKLAVEGCAAVDQVFPERLGQGPADKAAGQTLTYEFEDDSRQIAADSDGYVQSIGSDVLMRLASENDLVLSIAARPGVFVTQGTCVITAYPKARVSDEIDEDLRGAVVIGRDRTSYQDLEFAIRRIVELAQRSLSPGINDPTTALYCIDRLGQVFGRLADREIPSPMRLDEGGQLRVLTEVFDLGDVTCRSFAAIARYGMTDTDVVAQLAETLAKLEKSFPLAASVAVSELLEQVMHESGGATVPAFDRKTLLDLQENSGKKP